MHPLFLFQGIGMVAVALLAFLYWRRLRAVPIAFFFWGGLSWLVAIVLKSVASAPMPQITARLRAYTPEYLSEPILWLYVGLLTGVFECGVSYMIVGLIPRLRAASWSEAVGYGLGFGAMEALLLGIYVVVVVSLTITNPDQLPPELVDTVDAGSASLLAIPVPVIERAIVILLHVFSSILIIYAVRKRERKWLWVALLYKTGMDAIAGYIQVTYGVENLTLGGVWLVELVLLPFGVVGLWGLIEFRSRWQPNMSSDT